MLFDLPPYRNSLRVRLLSLAAAALMLCGAFGMVTWSTGASAQPTPTASTAISSFFSGYVDPDGRVVRRDQGGDTVSEGQSYALLLAVAADRPSEFATVWKWTQTHLQQPDGLFAWHWAAGRVLDTNSASDADVAIAWALALAGTRFHDPSYTVAARSISNAVLDRDTVAVHGNLVLVAGSWDTKAPVTIDPSYFSPAAYSALWQLSYDPRWHEVATSSLALVAELTETGDLPPDWARLSSDAQPEPVGGPNASEASQPASYGLDAARSLVWYAADCTAAQRTVARRAWPRLQPTARSETFPIRLSLAGTPESQYTNALMPVADAAAAATSGDPAGARDYLEQAATIDSDHSTYYGTAWLALGEVLLTSHDLDTCPPM